MAATASDIVARAFRRLGIKAEDETLSADQAAHGLDVLNSMMAEWRLHGINYDHASLANNDPFPLSDSFIPATVTLLAGELAPDYGAPVALDLLGAKALLQMNLIPPIAPVSVDTFLLRRSPLNGYRR